MDHRRASFGLTIALRMNSQNYPQKDEDKKALDYHFHHYPPFFGKKPNRNPCNLITRLHFVNEQYTRRPNQGPVA
jgi:hypothetical protein